MMHLDETIFRVKRRRRGGGFSVWNGGWGWMLALGLLTMSKWAACSDDNGTIHNVNNSSPDAGSCVDRCQPAERQCVTGGYQPCGDFDSDDCLEWGPVVPCNQDEECVDGDCVPAANQDECVEGAVICAEGGLGTRSCEYRSGPQVWVWGEEVPCPADENCSCGRCRSVCVDECAQGSKRCWGDGFQICGDFDEDSCLEWGAEESCPEEQTCSNGVCETVCSHECTAGARRCSCSGNVVQDCGDFDDDECLEWGPPIPCAAGKTCSNGECSTSCEDECPGDGVTECLPSGTGYRECSDDNGDGCLEWGPDTDCPGDQTCQDGECGDYCDCDNEAGICEAGAPNTTTPCACDPDCGTPCESDGYCDDWCTPPQDPDCGCSCNTNEYCEAEYAGTADTCSCDFDCEPHEYACMDDAYCDSRCPSGVDPDCGEDPCRDRFMLVGYRNADEMVLEGSYNDPDPDEGAPWVELSPGISGGSAKMYVEFAAEHLDCVGSIRVQAWGYDDSTFGDGAEMYLYNWDTGQFDLLTNTIGSTEGFYTNTQVDSAPYMLCGSGAYAKCYIDVKIGAGGWDNTHLWDVYAEVHMIDHP